MRVRRLLLPATWLGATFAATALAWLAVSSAVADVADPVPAVVASPRTTSTGASAATDPAASSSAVTDPAATMPATDGPPATAPPANVAPPAGVGDAFTADNHGGDSGSSAPSTTTQSFNTNGGVVTMSCTGETASLVSATPQQGYTVTVVSAGPEDVEVVFTAGSDQERFRGQCSDGHPVAQVED